MHELAVSQGILSLVCECGRREGFRRVTRVVVEVGAAAAVEPEALAFCFDVAAAHTMASAAELVIERVALAAACEACGAEFNLPHLAAACPHCGAYGARLLRGRELRVKSIDGESN
jgi:hydrogenase nickel incorporation protein HypA/HybF